MKVSKKCVVSGRVQGVFYRQSTLEQATELGLTGWVRNLDSGEVECLISGEDKDVEALCQWLKQGPPAAKVSNVKVTDVDFEEHSGFVIMR
jgi:acylphosphatase